MCCTFYLILHSALRRFQIVASANFGRVAICTGRVLRHDCNILRYMGQLRQHFPWIVVAYMGTSGHDVNSITEICL